VPLGGPEDPDAPTSPTDTDGQDHATRRSRFRLRR
jgi:hypothetical protein